MMHYINGNVRVSILIVLLYGAVGLALSRPGLSLEAATIFALATLAAALLLIVHARASDHEHSNVSYQAINPATISLVLTANEVATLLWLMRRGKQRFAETSESITSMQDKGIIVRPWSGCSAWMVRDGIWNERERFMSARLLLSTPKNFPQNGAFL